MNTFAPIFSKILDSSIWDEPYHVRILWTALLSLKDADHIVRFNTYQLHKRANITQQETADALIILSSPDTKRMEPQPFDGRRIEKREDGWFIINGEKYEQEMRDVSRKFYKARKEREYRRNKKALMGGNLPGENEHEAAIRNGASQAELDKITVKNLPLKCQETTPEYRI